MNEQAPEEEIAAVRRTLAALEVERRRLLDRLSQLQKAVGKPTTSEPVKPTITNASSATEKVALFLRRFGGRTDVFPARWDDPKSGKSGYAPACSNEWIKGVCGKPQVKCGEWPSQASMIEGHLGGEDRVRPNRRNTGFVAGVYPLLFNDICQFLAVNFDKRDWSVDALAFLDACRQFEIPCSTPFGLWFSAVCGHHGRPIEPHGLSGASAARLVPTRLRMSRAARPCSVPLSAAHCHGGSSRASAPVVAGCWGRDVG